MMEILNSSEAMGNPRDSVCFETAFTGTVPETRLIRKRPRSNSLFPSTDSVMQRTSSRSGSSECILPKSSSSFSSTGSSPLLPPVPQTPTDAAFRATVSSLERLNPGYRDVSFDDLDDQFYTPLGKAVSESEWDEPVVTSCPELGLSVQLVLLAMSSKSRLLLQCVLKTLEHVFRSNSLNFSEEFTTSVFVSILSISVGKSNVICRHINSWLLDQFGYEVLRCDFSSELGCLAAEIR